MKLRDRIRRYKTLLPNRDDKTGMLYSGKLADQPRVIPKIALIAFLESDENTHIFHECVIQKADGKTRDEWRDWIGENFERVFTTGVLPGMRTRTAKHWTVKKFVGWYVYAAKGKDWHKGNRPHVKRKLSSAALAGRRNKAKRKRRKNR